MALLCYVWDVPFQRWPSCAHVFHCREGCLCAQAAQAVLCTPCPHSGRYFLLRARTRTRTHRRTHGTRSCLAHWLCVCVCDGVCRCVWVRVGVCVGATFHVWPPPAAWNWEFTIFNASHPASDPLLLTMLAGQRAFSEKPKDTDTCGCSVVLSPAPCRLATYSP